MCVLCFCVVRKVAIHIQVELHVAALRLKRNMTKKKEGEEKEEERVKRIATVNEATVTNCCGRWWEGVNKKTK